MPKATESPSAILGSANEKALLESTLEHMSQGISLFDEKLILQVCNRRFLELLDFPDELGKPGTPIEAFFRYNAARGDYGPGEMEEQVAERMALARKMEPHTFERERPDGTVLEITGKPLQWGGFVTTYSDITVRKRAEEAAIEAQKIAEEANREKTQFLNTVTHELRTPLTSIRSFTEILRDNPDVETEQRDKFLGIISSESQRLVRLINDLLDFAKMAAGRMEWFIKEIDFREIIEVATLSLQQMYDDKGIALEVRLPKEIPAIQGDRDRLVQVVINLLSNAYKFSPEGGGRVTLTLALDKAGVKVLVRDNGPGIPAGKETEIFEDFRQIVDENGCYPKGTGLGLAICRRIIVHLGGRIWVQSEPGEGATFIFTLPLSR